MRIGLQRNNWIRAAAGLLTALALLLAFQPVIAAEPPDRSVSFTVNYTDVVIGAGKTPTTLEVTLADKGKSVEALSLSVENKPAGWEVIFQDWSEKFEIWGVSLAPGDSKNLNLKILPADGVKEGNYTIDLKAISQDRVLQLDQQVKVRVKGTLVVMEKGVTMTTDYPSLKGGAGTQFQFKVDLANNTTVDRSFTLGASVQQGWQVSFQPAYERDTKISSISLKAGASKGLDVFILPPKNTSPKEYPVALTAKDGAIGTQLELKVEVTGTYDLAMITSNGILNTTATAGSESVVSLLIGNSGTADISQLTFISSKPEGWVINFNPDKLNNVKAGTLNQVDATIKPAANAIAGDYSVSLTASSDEIFKTIDLRVSVETSTKWGWVGIAIVLAVMAIIGLAFMRLGRR